MRSVILLLLSLGLSATPLAQDRYKAGDGKLRVALAQQPLGPNGPSTGPDTMAAGGIQKILADLGATVRVEKAQLTALEDTEYGGWKRLGMADILRLRQRTLRPNLNPHRGTGDVAQSVLPHPSLGRVRALR